MVLATIAKPPIAAIGAVDARLFRLHLADEGDQRLARGLAFGELLLADRHCEGVAAGRDSSGEVLRDRLDPAGRVFEPLFAEADLASDGELVVEMAVAQALEAGDLRGDAGLAHEPFVAGRDRFGEGELVRLRARVLDPADGAVARHGRVDEAGFAFEDLPAGRVDAALGRIGVELDLVVLVALALDPALALLDLRGQPRHVEMVQGFEAALGVDAGAHGLGRADQDRGPGRH